MKHGKQLESYLKKIDGEQPIPLLKFFTLLKSPELNLEFASDDVVARKVSGSLYRIIQLSPSLRRELNAIVDDKAFDRTSAAHQNNSHAYSVNGSMLLIREGGAHPQVLMFDTEGHHTPEIKKYRSALLIENRQNFISIDQTIQFIAQKCTISLDEINDTLTVFTEGNAVTNSLHEKFLSKFETIYLLLDVDAGGLQIASNLISMLPNTNIIFLIPSDIEQRLRKVRARASKESIEKVILLGRKHYNLTLVAKLIYDTERELEQESYLDD